MFYLLILALGTWYQHCTVVILSTQQEVDTRHTPKHCVKFIPRCRIKISAGNKTWGRTTKLRK